MTDIQIDRVPLPPSHGRLFKYPYLQMAIGDSFFATRKHLNVYTWTKTSGFKFTQRRVKENGVEGLRVWRIA